MNNRFRLLSGCILPVAIATFAACAPTRSEQLRTSLLPPAPVPPASILVPLPPRLDHNHYLKDAPTHLKNAPALLLIPGLTADPKAPTAQEHIRRAEQAVALGRRLYRQDDKDGARREFDRALDILLKAASEKDVDREAIEQKFDQLVNVIYRYDVDRLGAGVVEEEPGFDKAPLDDIREMTFPIDPRLRAKVKDEVGATASQLPLEENDAVVSYINFFSSERGRRTIINGLQRSGKYRPLIQRILDEEGVPQELIFLAQAESGFLPRAVSTKRATGMWQFIQSRGREYGLMQTPFSDDRLDPEKATRAAARHLRDLYTEFGDWYLAMAAYNCGPGCVARAVERTGYADFWELRKRNVLPRETMNYVPIILAMTIMAKNPKDYGLDDIRPEQPLEYDIVEISSPTHLALIADLVDRSVNEVRELNPALTKSTAPAGYQMRVPKGSGTLVMASLDTIPPQRRSSWRIHRVSAGDTIQAIAKQYRTAASSITAVNNGCEEELEAGDLLVIPAAPVQSVKPAARPAAKKAPVRRTSSQTKGSATRRAS